jgi:hypothetical protein
MSQERWDVVLYFPDGPMAIKGDLVCRGPVVRIGANPGPGGLKIEGYRGLDDRQAVIQAYDGASVSIAPVGHNQVRLAPHHNVDWSEIRPLSGPAYLTDGCAFHLGPAGRGATVHFVEARRLGVWEQQRVISAAADADPTVHATDVTELRANRNIPPWFLPSALVIAVLSAVAIVIPLVGVWQKDIQLLGPVDEGIAVYEVVDVQTELNTELYEGMEQPWAAFVQKPNAEAARRAEFLDDKENWDLLLMQYTTRSLEQHAKAWSFWRRLDEIRDDYSFVVKQLRKNNLPEVFAAIPYTESRYMAEAMSPVCAKGWWQLMPEVAHRVDVTVADCKFAGKTGTWTPTELAPPLGVLKNAPYIKNAQCRIPSTNGCRIDLRADLAESTRGSIELLKEAWEDPVIADSGAAVPIVILSHNGGYDDSLYNGGRKKAVNLKPAYERWLSEQGLEYDPTFTGKQVRCTDNDFTNHDACGSELHRHTQHYAYKIIAQHFLAVCYYGMNYGNDKNFAEWRDYSRGSGYCTSLGIPTAQQVREKR